MDQEVLWDVIFEVLIRTPLDTLDRFKKVSKGWKELIYDSTFFPFYLKKTGTLFGFFVQDIRCKKNVSKFVGVAESGEGCINKSWPCGDVRILGTCNQGIVCCETRKDKNARWYVGKPATNQWKAIPNPKLRYKTVGVAVIVSRSKPALRFKIIRLSEMKIDEWIDMEYACEIFDSKTWNWRKTRSVYLHYDEFIDGHQPAVTIGEFVYWRTSSNNVLAFHATQQNFDKFSLPQIHVHAEQLRLVEYQGGLGFSCSTPHGNVQLWITNSRDNYEWTRKMDIEIRVLEDAVTCPNLIGFCNSGTTFMKAFNEAVFFNVGDDTFTKKEIDFELRFANQFFQFRSDVECVDLRCVEQE